MSQDYFDAGYKAAKEGRARVSSGVDKQTRESWYLGFDTAVKANKHPRLTHLFKIRPGFTVGFITAEERSAA